MASEYFEWIKKNKFLKTVASHRETFSMIDVAMKAGGADTAVYLKQPELQLRMRRGLTFLKQEEHIEVVRQGLPKFFDLEVKNEELKFLPHQFPITFFNLEKLNGENAQISYSTSINKWIICSKNVSIAVDDLEEAQAKYSTEARFKFPLYIARHWFTECLPKAPNIDELKTTMDKYTFVGEVCDITENQHIVDNPVKQGLIFFALVPKTPSGLGTALCVLPDQAIPTFLKFNQSHVDVGSSCVVNSPDEFPALEKFIENLTVDASPDPYVCLSEGAVVYATDRMAKVLLLGKIKTNKYRILRRVRELLKNATRDNDVTKLRSRFRQDLKKWGYTDPKDYSAYMLLLEACNHVRVSQKWPLDKISWRFIDFLHAAIAEINAGRVRSPAPALSDANTEPLAEEENANQNDARKARSRRHRGKGKRGPKPEADSSEDEDKAFACLPGDITVS
jgi:hypothetical protein